MKKTYLSFLMSALVIGATSCTPSTTDSFIQEGGLTAVTTAGGGIAGGFIDKNNRGRGAATGAALGNMGGKAVSQNYTNDKDREEQEVGEARQNRAPSFSIPGLPSSNPFPGVLTGN